LNFEISAVTDIGISKDKNQDSFHIRLCDTIQGQAVFAIICDGMGGLDEGEVASATVVKHFCKWADDRLPRLCEWEQTFLQIREEWMDLVEVCSHKIQAYGEAQDMQLGTTATALLLLGDMYCLIHIGDTRIYEIADEVKILTTDHSVVAREVELGLLSPEQAKIDPRRHILHQCIGASEKLCPEFRIGKITEGAVYLLCSDGFRHKITLEEIFMHFNADAMLEFTLHYNMKKLVDLNKERKEKDNITVVGIRTGVKKHDVKEELYA